jgi:hypothetical protein
VKLLERERAADDGTPREPVAAGPQDAPAAEPGTRACASCGAALEPGQEWCLNCGAAAGAVSERPGWRAAMTVLGLTLVLVAGAVAASFAALSDDPGQAGPLASNPAAPAPTASAPAETTPTTPVVPNGSGGDGETGSLPKVKPPSSTSTRAPKATPVPTSSTTTPSVTPRPSPSPSPAPSTGSSSGTGSSTTPGSSGTDTTPPTPPAERIDLQAGDASVYDPYGRALATGAPGKAIDGEAGTSWYVDTAPGAAPIGIGYALDLGRARGIRRVEITTPTPGFRVEVYATDETTPPPSILDSRWAHITDRANVGADGDGPERIILGAGTSKYQTLLLWITRPPASGTRVRFSELKIYG